MEDYCIAVELLLQGEPSYHTMSIEEVLVEEASAPVMLSIDEKMRGEITACVNLAVEDLSSREALIAVFMAVDCFTFLTRVLCLGAMGGGWGCGMWSEQRR